MAEYRGLNESRGRGMPPAHEQRRPTLVEEEELARRWAAVDMSTPVPLDEKKVIEKRSSKTIIRIKK